MTQPFLKTTVAAGLLVVCGCAFSAAVETLDFEGLVSGTTPVAVSGIPADKLKNFSITGAYAYKPGMINSANDPAPSDTPTGGFIANRARYDGGADFPNPTIITLALTDYYKGRYIESIELDFYTNASNPLAKIVGRNAGAGVEEIEFSSGAQNKTWSDTKFVFTSLQVTRLEFNAGAGQFGIDNLKITLGGSTTVPKVPEPASYALVGLALLAAGATRRRKV